MDTVNGFFCPFNTFILLIFPLALLITSFMIIRPFETNNQLLSTTTLQSTYHVTVREMLAIVLKVYFDVCDLSSCESYIFALFYPFKSPSNIILLVSATCYPSFSFALQTGGLE